MHDVKKGKKDQIIHILSQYDVYIHNCIFSSLIFEWVIFKYDFSEEAFLLSCLSIVIVHAHHFDDFPFAFQKWISKTHLF